MNFMEMQLGDVTSTSADNKRLEEYLGFKPDTPIKLEYKNLLIGMLVFIR